MGRDIVNIGILIWENKWLKDIEILIVKTRVLEYCVNG